MRWTPDGSPVRAGDVLFREYMLFADTWVWLIKADTCFNAHIYVMP